MHRIAITGSSGYVGRRLVEAIRRHLPQAKILGIDRVRPRDRVPDRFEPVDICDPRLGEVLSGFAPDTVVHLAFILNPSHREREMRRINVEGTRNALHAADTAGASRILFASSVVALGAAPDNPVPMRDIQERVPGHAFRYAADKSEAEAAAASLAEERPGLAVSWVRPAIILGPGTDNYLSRLLLRFPVVFLLDGCNTPMQFVHVDDVVNAMVHILLGDGRGPFNVAPGDSISLLEIALETGRRAVSVPMWAARSAVQLTWALRLPVFEAPAAMLDYLRHPCVMAPERLEKELGFAFGHTSRDALRSVLGAGGAR